MSGAPEPDNVSVSKGSLGCGRFSQPGKGRHRVALGGSPGLDGPHPAFGTPLPLSGRGDGGEGGGGDPRLAPWATRCRPLRGLISSTNF